MSIQLESSTKSVSKKLSPSQSRIEIANDRWQRLQRYFALATIAVPFAGTIAALVLGWQCGIGRVELGLFAGMYVLTYIGVTVGFHRHFAHKTFETQPGLRVILAILGSMAVQGPLINWVATHRRHHQYSDRPGDPHSPYIYEGESLGQLHGLWHSHLGWMMNAKITNSALFAKDLLRDPAIVKVNQQYLAWVILGLAIPSALGGLLAGTWVGVVQGFLWGGMVRMFVVHHCFWYIGSLAHILGHRSFETREESRNNIWTALLTWGESWHNNHHAFPNSAIFGLEWWQLDLGAWVIRTLEKLGLVWDVKKPTKSAIAAKKSAV